MKKQKKLILTISSLCLCLTILAFGVYAATNVSFVINNSVTYTFNDVLVDVSTQLYSVSTTNTSIISPDSVSTMESSSWTLSSTGVTNGTLKSYTGSNGIYTQDDLASTGTASISFNLNQSFAYKVEITFSTVSSSEITISYNDTAFVNPSTDDNVTLVVSPGSTSTIKGDQTYIFTYYVLLDDATKEVNVSLPQLSFTVQKA